MHNQAMARQRGVATLVVSVGVALLMAVAAVGMMRSGILEQKIAANDIRARKAQEVAQAGLEYVLASNAVPETNCPSDGNLAFDESNYLFKEGAVAVSVPVLTSGYPVAISGCSSNASGATFYFVRSRVSSFDTANYFVESWFFRKKSVLNSNLSGLPSLMVVGNVCESKRNGGCLTASSFSGSREGFLDVIATGNVYGLSDSGYVYEERFNLGGNDVLGYVFDSDLSMDSVKTVQQGKDGIYYFEGNVSINNGSVVDVKSSEDFPVVVFLGKDGKNKCPSINGEVYGIVYIESGCNDLNGWGGAKIHGSVISDGSIDKIAGNAKFHAFSDAGWKAMTQSATFLLPGTWRDFEP